MLFNFCLQSLILISGTLDFGYSEDVRFFRYYIKGGML